MSFMQRFGHGYGIFDSVFRFFASLSEDINEFDVVDNDYYKSEKKKRKKLKSKSKQLLERQMMDYGYPKYITAVLYEYHYTNIESSLSSCDITDDDGNRNRKGIWWTRDRKKEYFPVFKYNKLDSIRDWMKSNGYLNRPIFDGESEISKIVKCIRL
eukprot:UN10308